MWNNSNTSYGHKKIKRDLIIQKTKIRFKSLNGFLGIQIPSQCNPVLTGCTNNSKKAISQQLFHYWLKHRHIVHFFFNRIHLIRVINGKKSSFRVLWQLSHLMYTRYWYRKGKPWFWGVNISIFLGDLTFTFHYTVFVIQIYMYLTNK